MRHPHARARAECASAWRSEWARLRAQRDRQFVRARQLAQMPQRELLEERRRRSIEERAAEPFGSPNDVDQAALEQRLEHAAHRHTANFLDVGARDGLAVRDDRQRLERRRGEALRPGRQLGTLDGLRELRAREYLPAAA